MPRSGPRTLHKYSDEFKQTAVRSLTLALGRHYLCIEWYASKVPDRPRGDRWCRGRPAAGASGPADHRHASACLPAGAGNAAWPFRRMCINDAKPCSNQSSRDGDRGDYLLRETLDMMTELNVVLGFLSGDIGEVSRWSAAAPGRFVRSVSIYNGLQVGVRLTRGENARLTPSPRFLVRGS